jgi:hypothetical protein
MRIAQTKTDEPNAGFARNLNPTRQHLCIPSRLRAFAVEKFPGRGRDSMSRSCGIRPDFYREVAKTRRNAMKMKLYSIQPPTNPKTVMKTTS